jgi:hypothetical protein
MSTRDTRRFTYMNTGTDEIRKVEQTGRDFFRFKFVKICGCVTRQFHWLITKTKRFIGRESKKMSIFFYELIGLDTKNIDLIDIGGESYQKDIYVYLMDIYSHFRLFCVCCLSCVLLEFLTLTPNSNPNPYPYPYRKPAPYLKLKRPHPNPNPIPHPKSNPIPNPNPNHNPNTYPSANPPHPNPKPNPNPNPNPNPYPYPNPNPYPQPNPNPNPYPNPNPNRNSNPNPNPYHNPNPNPNP